MPQLMAYQSLKLRSRHNLHEIVTHVLSANPYPKWMTTRRNFLISTTFAATRPGSSVGLSSPSTQAVPRALPASLDEVDLAFRKLTTVFPRLRDSCRLWIQVKREGGVNSEAVLAWIPERVEQVLLELRRNISNLAHLKPTAQQLETLTTMPYPEIYKSLVFGNDSPEPIAEFILQLQSDEGIDLLFKQISDTAMGKAWEYAQVCNIERVQAFARPIPPPAQSPANDITHEIPMFPAIGTAWKKDATPIPHDYYHDRTTNSWRERMVNEAKEIDSAIDR